jgi:long-chain acyl-CoA synthetase
VSGIGYWSRTAPDATAVATTGGALTFGKLNGRARALAGAFKVARLHRGDRVAVYAANRIEVIEVCTAALRAGLVPVPVNSLLTEREVEFVLEDSGARWLFSDRAVESPVPERIITFGDAYERTLHEADPVPLADVTLGRAMHYTSGTTGEPKAVWVRPVSEARAQELSRLYRDLWGLTSEDVHLVCSPLAHSAPLRFVIRTLEAGGTAILQTRFDAAESLAAMELFGVTSVFMVPTHLERIIDMGSGALARHDLSSVRLLAHAGSPIRPETKRAVIDLFPRDSVWEFYGATEGQATRISAREWLQRPGSVGTALPGGSVTVKSENRRALPPGTVGDVWIEEPTHERFEYWGQPARTAGAWDGDSFNVGDLGYLDADGYLYLSGRKHDTIITGGVNVFPREVEELLATHPAVAEVAVYGARHEEWGEEIRALVVPAAGQPLDPELLRVWARERLAGFKCPRRIDVVSEIPRTATGKVQRPDP